MAPRRRMSKNSDLPTGLTVVKVRGADRFRYRYPSGQAFYFPTGTTRFDAIQATLMFNVDQRSPEKVRMEKADKYNRQLSHWLPIINKRVVSEENLGENAQVQFESDCELLTKHFSKIYSKSINLETVNDFLAIAAAGKSNNVYNRKIGFLRKVFKYMIDEGAMTVNYADMKKPKPKEKKKRTRLKLADFKMMLEAARQDPNLQWLHIAMRLSLQTTHATLEVSRMKYRDVRNGYLRIHRQKVQDKEASRVEIPVTDELQKVIDESRKLASPYIVQRRGRYASQIGEGCDHPFQVSSKQISRQFSELRDKLGICSNMPKEERPTFHEIRALSIHLYDKAGVDPQSRAAHTDAKSTMVYKENHVEWVRVPAAEIKIS
jgi:enterobacteria phage integrase